MSTTPPTPLGAPALADPTLARDVAKLGARVLLLVYGIAAYLLFLATFLYAVGFVSGSVVPTTVDGGRAAGIVEAIVVDALLLLLFAVQHTVMARTAFKRRFTRIVPAPIERATFVLATCAVLGLLFWQWRALPGTWWVLHPPLASFVQGVGFLGWGIVLFASFLIDHFELFGLRQVVRHFRGAPPVAPEFRERTLYRVVRHPLMLGFLLAFWATPVMTSGHLLFAVLCTGYILFGIQVEERSLIAAHGERYLAYRRRVPMLVPLPRRRE